MRVKELAELLKKEIRRKQLAPGSQVDSARKLITKYEVSLVTANRALNLLTDEKILYRIQGGGTFVASREHMFSRHITTIGLSFYNYPSLHHSEGGISGFGQFQNQIVDMIKQNNCNISMVSRNEKKNLDLFAQTISNTDGLIINKDLVRRENIPLLLNYNRPVILMDLPCVRELPFHQVVPDYFIGFKKLIDYLEELGCDSIVPVGVSNTEAHNYRRKLFRKTVDECGSRLRVMDDLTVELLPNDMGRSSGRLIAKKYLQLKERPAIFAVSDFIALGILDVLLDNNLKPGKDFKLIGYDNLEANGFCPFEEPMLTSLEAPKAELASQIVKLLFEQIKAQDKMVRIVKVPVDKLVIRKTT